MRARLYRRPRFRMPPEGYSERVADYIRRRNARIDTWRLPLPPTLEETLEVNARSIVSLCRALIAGTLEPRSWGDFAATWRDEPEHDPPPFAHHRDKHGAY